MDLMSLDRDGIPVPRYRDWEHFLAAITSPERSRWCSTKASRANLTRLRSVPVDVRLTGADVWAVCVAARSRCCFCGSFAVERGHPEHWPLYGRRVGTIDHIVRRADGGSNGVTNLAWARMWCNHSVSFDGVPFAAERIPGSLDHGGYYPADS